MTYEPSRLLVGPAGNSESFYAAGFKRTVDTFAWQQEHFQLDAFEVPFGRGVSMSLDTAREIGQAARAAGVSLSAHAPYFVNLGSPNPDSVAKSYEYILSAAARLAAMGGQHLVVHVGSPKGHQDRADAVQEVSKNLLLARKKLVDAGFKGIRLCLETMGRPSVIGSLPEILHLVSLDDSFLPCLDVGHLHAAQGGALNTSEDFAAILDQSEASLGISRARLSHFHVSRIEYGKKGEIRHRTFAEASYGPDHQLLLPLLISRHYQGTIICESNGTMAEDAGQIKYQLNLLAQNLDSDKAM